jgi:hypothetical protein
MDSLSDHRWPADQADHKWGPWRQKTKTGTGKPAMQTRACIHPGCGAYQEREAPK